MMHIGHAADLGEHTRPACGFRRPAETSSHHLCSKRGIQHQHNDGQITVPTSQFWLL